MATLALAAVGSAVGSTLMPAGMTLFGATLSGAAIGAQVGAFAGSYVDQALFGASGQARTVEGPRLREMQITGSTEGEAIPRLYGRARLGGQVIWADAIEERISKTKSAQSSGKGGFNTPAGGNASVEIEYQYFASFAVALCEGTIGGIGRIWADGQAMSLSKIVYRLHKGSEHQPADSLIEARLGAASTPAFRGLAYVVFQSLPLAPYGNRIPQLAFEVYKPVESFGEEIKGIVVIPGSGEFIYADEPVWTDFGLGRNEPANVHTRQAATDWAASIDQLEATLPNAKSASLVVSWFGDDLRAGACRIKPGVEFTTKTTVPLTWSVAGLARADAHLVSTRDGRPAYGGTPSDQTVVAAIADLKARGFDVVLTPFVLMDVPEGNGLPDPYTGGASQPSYPWRGRITVSPAPGLPGSPDKTAAAAVEISDFVGSAEVAHYAISGTTVHYSGPVEWSYRRMVLHMAHLAKAAGGVDAFVIGTELRGLTWIRSAASTYPFVSALVALAADVKSVLGAGTKVLYAADWSEYFGHQPADGTGDVYFHLDPLWSSASIDAIGIDLYWPLADWRDGTTHLDFADGVRSPYSLAYLRSNVAGGEGFDWYYASGFDRTEQVRTQITDSAGKPWVFRFKDIRSWWQHQHFNRPGGVESVTPTGWVPQSKPFWLMEVGCPAVDKGANQPNVFVDPKSAESAVPYFSRGSRDDLIQRRYLRALIQAFDPASSGYLAGLNPLSSVTGQRMVDLSRVHVYCWDARPFPEFPYNTDVWGDGDNWRLGHWLNGRFAAGPLAETVQHVLTDYGFTDFESGGIDGTVPGFVVDRIMSARDALQPLELAYFFDSIESEGRIVFRMRGSEPSEESFTVADLVETAADEPLFILTRGQETELPAAAKITYITGARDYRQAVAETRRLAGGSSRVAQASLPLVLDPAQAAEIAGTWLFESWATRERASFSLPPSALALEPGDNVSLDTGDGARLLRITELAEHGARAVEARSLDPAVYAVPPAAPRESEVIDAPVSGRPLVEFLDLPLLRGDELPECGYVAALQSPWPGGVAIYTSPETTGYQLRALASAPAVMGTILDPMPAGPEGVMDLATHIRVEVGGGELVSVSGLQLLSGANAAAVRNEAGEWEVFQYAAATLVAPSTYELSGLLRGQAGTGHAMRSPLASGARFVALTVEVEAIPLTVDELHLPLSWRFGPSARAIGDVSYQDRQHAFSGIGLRPLSPVHVKGRRSAGDLIITWIRRTRLGGDNWEAAEVPLAEESERYEVDIMSGTTAVRTLSANEPSVVYSAAEQIADFGATQPACTVIVFQLGAVFGRGSPAAAVV